MECVDSGAAGVCVVIDDGLQLEDHSSACADLQRCGRDERHDTARRVVVCVCVFVICSGEGTTKWIIL